MGSSPPLVPGRAARLASAGSSTSDTRSLHLDTTDIPYAMNSGPETLQRPQIIHYDHSRRVFLEARSTESFEHRVKSEPATIYTEDCDPHPSASDTPCAEDRAKEAKKRKLRDFLAHTPTVKAFANYEAKQLQDHPRRTIHPEVQNKTDDYRCRPFSETDFDLQGITPSLIDLHEENTSTQIGELDKISARIAVASQHIRKSQDQLADAYDRKSEVELEINELRIDIYQSWEHIQTQQADPRDPDAWNTAQAPSEDSPSFAIIEAKLRDLTRKKRLIELEIDDREAKRRKIEGAVAAFTSPKGSTQLENLEEVADAYIPVATGL